MALAFVNRQDAVVAGRPDDLEKEWQECRSVISRFDSMLVDLRKYGFGLVSGLLTANGILGGIANLLPKPGNGTPGFIVPSPVIAALVSITMVLIAVLFVIDRYYSVLKWAATDKAQSLERTLSLGCMTGEMIDWARRQGWATYVVLLQYGSFILVSAFLGAAVMGGEARPLQGHPAADLMWLVGLLSLASIVALFFFAKKEWDKLSPGLSNVVPGVTMVSVTLITLRQPQPVIKGGDCQEVVVNHQFPQNSKVLAIVKPTDQDGLSIVGCRVTGPQQLVITFRNDTTQEITPTPEDCTVFLHA